MRKPERLAKARATRLRQIALLRSTEELVAEDPPPSYRTIIINLLFGFDDPDTIESIAPPSKHQASRKASVDLPMRVFYRSNLDAVSGCSSMVWSIARPRCRRSVGGGRSFEIARIESSYSFPNDPNNTQSIRSARIARRSGERLQGPRCPLTGRRIPSHAVRSPPHRIAKPIGGWSSGGVIGAAREASTIK